MKRFDEAMAEIKRALELDPLSVIMNRIYADIFMDQRRFDEAIEQYRKTLEMDPKVPTTQYFLGRAYEAKGMYDQAVIYFAISGELAGLSPEILEDVNQVYAKSGWKAYLEKSLEHMLAQPRNRFPPFLIATQYARLAQKEETLSSLQQAYEERDFRVRHVIVMFEFDNLRSDPRFVELVQKLGCRSRIPVDNASTNCPHLARFNMHLGAVSQCDQDTSSCRTEITNLPFAAMGKERRFITTLRAEDVRMLEDGVPQQVFTFQRETEHPLAIAFLIDVSRSQEFTLTEKKRRRDRLSRRCFSRVATWWQSFRSPGSLISSRK